MRSVHGSVEGKALAGRLQRLRLQRGWNMDHVAAAAGISRTTLFHLERGETARPRASTLHKLACVFEVPTGELVQAAGETAGSDSSIDAIRDPQSALRKTNAFRDAFDRATNPVVARVAVEEPALFAGWSSDEWEELYSQFATGGALREEGVRATAVRINHDRETLYRLRVVLQTHLAEVAAGMVDTLYKLVSVEPIPVEDESPPV